ncbi:hypothetical protein O1L60_34560 [Streptomyces diastatochromogenes]|nr:hypothetical protein [Streptomyces diastatochromogenes]
MADAPAPPQPQPRRLPVSSAPVSSDEQRTVLGKRHRSDPATPLTPMSGGDGDDDEIVLRFGPGVPPSEEEALRGLWAAPRPLPLPSPCAADGGAGPVCSAPPPRWWRWRPCCGCCCVRRRARR